MNKKLVIGVTGCFGSGKTTVTNIMKELTGCYVINADKIAKKIMEGKIKKDIKLIFGTINRRKIAEIVFNDKEKLTLLDRIVHPHVISEVKKMIAASKKGTVVIDVPLLVESGMQNLCDKIILVKCRKSVVLSRVDKRYSKQMAEKIIRSQLPFSKKLKYADYVIDNSYSLEKTKKKVKNVCKFFVIA